MVLPVLRFDSSVASFTRWASPRPEGGDGGGTIVCTGTPEEVAACEGSYTGQYLRKVLAR